MTTLTGTAQSFNLNADGSMALTVPADAEGIVVSISGLGIAASTQLFSQLNFANDSSKEFALINAGLYAASSVRQIENYLLTTNDVTWPGTGAQTLYYAAPDGYNEGFNVLIYYVKDLDVANPILGTDTDQGNTVTSPWDSDIAGAGPNDLHIVAAYNYQAAPTVNDTGQTEVATPSVYNNAGLGVAYEQGATSMRISFTGDLVPTAFVLRSKPLPAITSIDGDNEVYRGQTGVIASCANIPGTAQITGFTAGTTAFANVSHIAGASTFTFDVPLSISNSSSASCEATYTE